MPVNREKARGSGRLERGRQLFSRVELTVITRHNYRVTIGVYIV